MFAGLPGIGVGTLFYVLAVLWMPVHEMGRVVPRMVIHDFVCTYNGAEVIRLALFPAIAANPFLAFSARAEESGAFTFTWADDSGASQTETALIVVE